MRDSEAEKAEFLCCHQGEMEYDHLCLSGLLSRGKIIFRIEVTVRTLIRVQVASVAGNYRLNLLLFENIFVLLITTLHRSRASN